MQKIRIGKDIRVSWRILTNGADAPLTDRDLHLEVADFYDRRAHDFRIEEGNRVVFVFAGSEQRHLGRHTFTLWENRGKEGQTVVDSCDGIELVPTTCREACGGLEPCEVDLCSILEAGVKGDSAYETWLSQGHEGTEDDFLAWLRQPADQGAELARAAAEEATRAATAASSAASSASATDTAVQKNEASRVQSESARQTAEQERVKAEQERAEEFARLKEASETATAAASSAAAAANEAAEGIDGKISGKQDATDQTLKTEDKTIVGAINEVHDALGEVSDKTDGIQTDLTQAKADTAQLNRDLGVYDTAISIPMTVEKSGKYVDPDGQEKSSASMGISAPLEVKSGNIYLLQCAAAVGTGVALFARKVTNTYDKVIAYSYTYNGDGTIATATADYDPELVYSYSYNEEGVATITDKDGETVPELPATHQVTESFYEPLFRTNDATMPKSGYYLLLCTQDMEIVVSAASSDITGKNLLGVRYGVFASIATNFVGSPGQKVIAQAFAELYAAVQALSSVVDNAGHLKADVLDMANLPKVCGEDMYLTGEGAPAAPPTVPFQEYYDSENLKFYKAKGVLPDSPTTGDWVAIN